MLKEQLVERDTQRALDAVKEAAYKASIHDAAAQHERELKEAEERTASESAGERGRGQVQ